MKLKAILIANSTKMGKQECGFIVAVAIFFSVSTVAFIWAAIDYSDAYKVETTKCQYVKHWTSVGSILSRYAVNGYVVICWQVPELEPNRVDGPVTLCRSDYALTGVFAEQVIAELKEKYPITHPPTMFPCYKTAGKFGKLFLSPPDLESYKDKLSVATFTFLCGFAGVGLYFLLLSFKFRAAEQKPKQE